MWRMSYKVSRELCGEQLAEITLPSHSFFAQFTDACLAGWVSGHSAVNGTLLSSSGLESHRGGFERLRLARRYLPVTASSLMDMEQKLKLSQTEGTSQDPKVPVDQKFEMVLDLEEKVHRSKRDRRNSLHRTQLLESQMKTVRGELADTLDHLQLLRNVLRRSQENAEARKAAMDKLAAELR
ncbi:coiled-coil domain-containing protein 18-like [Arapaima gigas]